MYSEVDKACMKQAFAYANNSTCLSRKVGCSLVNHVGTSYTVVGAWNGPLTKCSSCLRPDDPASEKLWLCSGLHAEERLLVEILDKPERARGAILYITDSPCRNCARLIAYSGIRRVVFCREYKDWSKSLVILKTRGITVDQIGEGELWD